MGLITQILTLPLAPVRGTVWVLDQVVLTAEREYYDPAPVHENWPRWNSSCWTAPSEPTSSTRREDELLDRLEWLEAQQRRLRTDS